MSEENKTIKLTEDELKKVTGGVSVESISNLNIGDCFVNPNTLSVIKIYSIQENTFEVKTAFYFQNGYAYFASEWSTSTTTMTLSDLSGYIKCTVDSYHLVQYC